MCQLKTDSVYQVFLLLCCKSNIPTAINATGQRPNTLKRGIKAMIRNNAPILIRVSPMTN